MTVPGASGSPPEQNWGTMVDQVIVHGDPGALWVSGLAWEELVSHLHTLRADLLQNLADFQQFDLWKGAAFDEYARRVTAVATKLEEIIADCQKSGGVGFNVKRFAEALDLAQREMRRPRELHDDIAAASSMKAEGATPAAFTKYAKKLEQTKTNNADTVDWVPALWWDNETTAARKIYNTLNQSTSTTGANLPDPGDKRDEGFTPPSSSNPPPLGGTSGNAGIPGGGVGGNINSRTPEFDSSSRPPYDSPSDLGGKGAEPLDDSLPSWTGTPPSPTADDHHAPPLGGGLASSRGLTDGLPTDSGLPAGSTADSGFSSRSVGQGGGMPTGGLGKPVSPPIGGTASGGMPMAGGAGQSGRQRQGRGGSPVAPGGPLAGGQPGSSDRRTDRGTGASSWLREDEETWTGGMKPPPPVLGSEEWE